MLLKMLELCSSQIEGFVNVGPYVKGPILIFVFLTNGLKKEIFKTKNLSDLMAQRAGTLTGPWFQGPV